MVMEADLKIKEIVLKSAHTRDFKKGFINPFFFLKRIFKKETGKRSI